MVEKFQFLIGRLIKADLQLSGIVKDEFQFLMVATNGLVLLKA